MTEGLNVIKNKTKPQITKDIEGPPGSDANPNTRAETLLSGLRQGKFAITSDFLTDLFRVAAAGCSPGHGIKDLFLTLVCWVNNII
jgi:3-dehydrosphinganine reductase